MVSNKIKFSKYSFFLIINLRDNEGYLTSSNVSIRKDIIAPIVQISFPENLQVFNNTIPTITFSVEEKNLDMIWLTLDDGNNSLTVSNFEGIINYSIWSSLNDGAILMTLYAEDQTGNLGSDEVTITKISFEENADGDNDGNN